MKYWVTYKIKANFIAEIEADSIEDALDLAENEFVDADFGVAENITGEPLIMEDEKGNYVWEKA